MEEDIAKLWGSLVQRYKDKNSPLDLNFKREAIRYLGRPLNTLTHYVHPYPGKIFPYIPRFLLSVSELCPEDGTVLDPFCGSGTVLLESITHSLYKRQALGIEINPLARLIAKVKTTPLDRDLLQERTNALLSSLEHPSATKLSLPQFRNFSLWFSEKNAKNLAFLRESIKAQPDDDIKDFFYVCFSSIIRKFSNADPFIPPPVKLKKEKYRKSRDKDEYLARFLKNRNEGNVKQVFGEKVLSGIREIESLNSVSEVFDGKIKAKIIWDDARAIKIAHMSHRSIIQRYGAIEMPSASVDLILTSPPYLTAQKYIRTLKLETLWLELLSESDLVELSRDIIGSESCSKARIKNGEKVGIAEIDKLVEWSVKISFSRGLNVLKYFLDMKQVMTELHRILKKDGKAIIVIGNNDVLSRHVKTYKLLSELGHLIGLETQLILRDEIRGRGMITRRHDNGGLIKYEYALIMNKE